MILTAALTTFLLINLVISVAAWRVHQARIARLRHANGDLEAILRNQQTYIDELQSRVVRLKGNQPAPNFEEIDLYPENSGIALVSRVWMN